MMHKVAASVHVEMEAFRAGDAGQDLSCRQVFKGRNLLMDFGLDNVAANGWLDGFAYFGLGRDPITLRRDSGEITFTRTGLGVVASASFFDVSDIGRVLVLNGDAQEMRITGYTSATSVTVAGPSRNVSAAQGTVLYCNQIALPLAGPLARFYAIGTNSNANGSAWNGTTGVLSTWVTRISDAAGVDTTYKSIGWFRDSSAPTSLTGAVNINGGAGDTLLAGEQYRVRVQLDRKLSPLSVVAGGALISGWAANCNSAMEGIGYSVFNSTGGIASPTSFNQSLEPSAIIQCSIHSQALALRAPTFAGAVSVPSGQLGTSKSGANQTYVSGSFYRDVLFSFGLAEGNYTNWRSIAFGQLGSAGQCAFRVLLSADSVKTTDQTLSLTLRKSWGRDLSEFL